MSNRCMDSWPSTSVLSQLSHVIIVTHGQKHWRPHVRSMLVRTNLDLSDLRTNFWGSKKSQTRICYSKMHGCKNNPLVWSIFGRAERSSHMQAHPAFFFGISLAEIGHPNGRPYITLRVISFRPGPWRSPGWTRNAASERIAPVKRARLNEHLTGFS